MPSGLGPTCVGIRVVVRRLVAGETGPSGGPAMTDVLGVMESWDDTSTTLRRDDGTLVTIERASIVAGKPVPPRPSRHHRVGAEEAARRAHGSWPAVEAVPLGDWVLRASGGFSARANSVLLAGAPGLPWNEALAVVTRFYAEGGLPAWAQVTVGSPEQERLQGESGWVLARPGEADSEFHVAGIAQAARACRGMLPADPPSVTIAPTLSDAWLATDDRAREHGADARAVLEGPAHTGLATVVAGGGVVARGRIAFPADDDWAGITDVWVSPDDRRERLGIVVLHALLGWAAERGATTAYLQVRADNPPGLALYGRLGFEKHHAYRYLRST
jgi:N-acetylglutamate synthase